MENENLYQSKILSPIGELFLIASEMGLKSIEWEELDVPYKETKVLKQAKKELKEYFLGKRTKFEVPLDIRGTEFQRRVWKELMRIPFGKTISYKALADRLKTRGYQAVGSANGKNPLCIIIPCHRVLSHDGTLGGYSGGLDKKIKLLNLEGYTLL